mmetsp:Transcript_20764/g.66698  ORF Transcript_20764/g.66698 Transcript_20764/m.66698 type:complete len:217 (-) Transcript_20764:774-1424(-)
MVELQWVCSANRWTLRLRGWLHSWLVTTRRRSRRSGRAGHRQPRAQLLGSALAQCRKSLPSSRRRWWRRSASAVVPKRLQRVSVVPRALASLLLLRPQHLGPLPALVVQVLWGQRPSRTQALTPRKRSERRHQRQHLCMRQDRLVQVRPRSPMGHPLRLGTSASTRRTWWLGWRLHAAATEWCLKARCSAQRWQSSSYTARGCPARSGARSRGNAR